jgi:stage II sporulation protein AA (anti-sigma F factor antagonist)
VSGPEPPTASAVEDTHRAARPALSIDHTTVDCIRVVTLRGEIGHAVTEEFTEALLSYGSVTPPRTVVDLSGVTFMDSGGSNALIAAHQGMSDAQGWCRVAAAQASVLRALSSWAWTRSSAAIPPSNRPWPPDRRRARPRRSIRLPCPGHCADRKSVV